MFILNDDLKDAIKKYPLLKIIEKENCNLSLSGEIEIFHPIENKVIDTFSVEMTFPKEFPHCFPKVVETSNKIERTVDRHLIVTQNNTLCFAVIAEELILCRLGITTRWFLNNILVPRLAEEYIVNHGGKYTHEFSHGPLGDLEFYYQKFRTKNPNIVVENLKFILKDRLPKSYEKCICGSGLKFKKCHRRIFEDLKELGNNFIIYQIHTLEKFLEMYKCECVIN